jgi:hypothetical protein
MCIWLFLIKFKNRKCLQPYRLLLLLLIVVINVVLHQPNAQILQFLFLDRIIYMFRGFKVHLQEVSCKTTAIMA